MYHDFPPRGSPLHHQGPTLQKYLYTNLLLGNFHRTLFDGENKSVVLFKSNWRRQDPQSRRPHHPTCLSSTLDYKHLVMFQYFLVDSNLTVAHRLQDLAIAIYLTSSSPPMTQKKEPFAV